ncbi:type II toxin-antitoxin system RelE/ParE family toxin [Ancylothrix sp. C2]|uniref:type II toxin-antitoxin system RelE family toxin n=1 Tax=Ancylothrix sp. D3o TaxID=2953691 RepID=UPI0021BAE9BC|nr:type II toxin-antitoxin system RelE/ParE family toxin [Ancylothrix sp. D3o]MCT7952066.1 type II toxin-antitoxin system RelE/ParE family toxin [Ancylothrix sp. D3o]
MNTEYLPSFIKDLKSLKSTPIFGAIKTLVFEEIPNTPDFEELRQVKKLQGYENAYRIRVGDYRIGLTFDGEVVIFFRVLHRKEFYNYFP